MTGSCPYADVMIRLATPADVPAIRTVIDAAFSHYVERIGVIPVPMLADHEANVAAGRVYVTGTPIDGLLVLVQESDHLLLDVVAVHPDAQGTGVGRRLLAFAEQHAWDLGLKEIRLYTNAKMWENQKLYPRYGYEATEHRVEGDYDRIHYRKRLIG
jgi:GNAT superfamily N-acetyltransferase